MEEAERTREILKKVRQVEIHTKRMVTDAMAGAYHSVFKGQGMNFEEVREYAPGDEVRSIDWNVTAKMDRPFVKKHREERELTIMLAVDLSASGSFGSASQSKRELAAEIASVLAFSATRNNDKVGLLLFTDKVETFIYPQKGRQHVLRVIREILFFKPENQGTDIVHALKYMNRLLKRKAVVFMLSDFLEGPHGIVPNPNEKSRDSLFKALALTHQRHDLTCIALSDPRENELPNLGIITLEDAETGQVVELNTGNPKIRERYAQANREKQENLKRGLRQAGIGAFTVHTDQPYLNALRAYFKRRSSRRH